MCVECKSAYHKGDCEKALDLKTWTKSKNAAQIGTCPRCSALFERISGCPAMICYVCKYRWCWYCGLSDDNIFHKIQLPWLNYYEENKVCKLMNWINTSFGSHCLPLRLLFALVVAIVGPPIMFVFSVILYPFVCVYLALKFSTKKTNRLFEKRIEEAIV